MKKIIFIIFIFISGYINAQKIKVKKGEVFLNKKKVASVEKIKNKGERKYIKVFNLKNEHILNGKYVINESKYFGRFNKSGYYIIECIKQNDTIGINYDWFALTEKGISKFLLKNNILTPNGINEETLKKVLSQTESVPESIQEMRNEEKRLIEQMDDLAERDRNKPLFVERGKTKPVYSTYISQSVTQTKFKIFQGESKSNKTLIGFAYIEVPEIGGSNLIISNHKDIPVGYFDSFKYFTFYPLTELKMNLRDLISLDKPIEAIYQFTQTLIDQNKI